MSFCSSVLVLNLAEGTYQRQGWWEKWDPIIARVHKNGRLEEERVTPIEVCSPVNMVEPYQNSNMPMRSCAYVLLILVQAVNSVEFYVVTHFSSSFL